MESAALLAFPFLFGACVFFMWWGCTDGGRWKKYKLATAIGCGLAAGPCMGIVMDADASRKSGQPSVIIVVKENW